MAILGRLQGQTGWFEGVTVGSSGSVEHIDLTPVNTAPAFEYRLTYQNNIVRTKSGQAMAVTYFFAGSDRSRIAYYQGTSYIGDDTSAPSRPRITSGEGAGVQVWSSQAGQRILVKIELI